MKFREKLFKRYAAYGNPGIVPETKEKSKTEIARNATPGNSEPREMTETSANREEIMALGVLVLVELGDRAGMTTYALAAMTIRVVGGSWRIPELSASA